MNIIFSEASGLNDSIYGNCQIKWNDVKLQTSNEIWIRRFKRINCI